MEFWLWMPQLFACTRARIKTQINRGLSPINTLLNTLLLNTLLLVRPSRTAGQTAGLPLTRVR